MNKLNNEAVSPVIGVILMVAITVILAAVIAVFVFGMADDVQTTKTVAVNVDRIDENSIQVTYMGGPDHDNLQEIEIKIDGSSPIEDDNGIWKASDDTLYVGKTGTYMTTFDGDETRASVVIVGKFNDGSEQVIYNSRV